MSEKIIGYILLTVGIMVILYSAIDVFLVFTKQKQPIQLFNFPAISIDPSLYTPQIEVPAGVEQYIPQKAPNNQKVELIPADFFNLSSNLFAHIMLMGFLANIGGKIATIGTQLARPVIVKLRQDHPQETVQK